MSPVLRASPPAKEWRAWWLNASGKVSEYTADSDDVRRWATKMSTSWWTRIIDLPQLKVEVWAGKQVPHDAVMWVLWKEGN